MTLEQEVIGLRAENAGLRAENCSLRAELATALKRIAELEQGMRRSPGFVKANRPRGTGAKAPRRKRRPEHNRARRREEPTRIVRHRREQCPDCGCRLHGNSVARRRQVVDLPPPQSVEVTEHQVIKGWCPRCERWHTPKLAWAGRFWGEGALAHAWSA